MTNNAKLLTVVAVLALVFGGLFLKGRRASRKQALGAAAARQTAPKSGKKGGKSALSAKAVGRSAREQHSADLGALGFVPIRVDEGAAAAVHVQMKPELRCEVGDIDIIEREIRSASGGHIILSVESLDLGSRQEPFDAQELSIAQLKQGFTTTLQVPSGGALQPVGLFICRDTSGRKSCAGKPGAVMRTAIDDNHPHQGPTGEIVQPPVKDRVYYFQSLVAGENSVAVLGTTMATEFQYAEISKTLGAVTGDSTTAMEAVGRMRSLNTDIFSAPAEVDAAGRTLVLTMPMVDHARCGKEQAAARPPPPSAPAAFSEPAPPMDTSRPQPKLKSWHMNEKDVPPELKAFLDKHPDAR